MRKKEWTYRRLFIGLIGIVREKYPAKDYIGEVRNMSKVTRDDIRESGLYHAAWTVCGGISGLRKIIKDWIREEEAALFWEKYIESTPATEIEIVDWEDMQPFRQPAGTIRKFIAQDMKWRNNPLIQAAVAQDKVIKKHITNIIRWKQSDKKREFIKLSITTDRDIRGLQSFYRMIQKNIYVLSVARSLVFNMYEEGYGIWLEENGKQVSYCLSKDDKDDLIRYLEDLRKYHH